jgi:cell division transport system ATP-binding protein
LENNLIELENVSLRYNLNREILNNVSLTIEPGGFYYVTGSSGAGKTSLLKLLFLSLKPSEGKLSVFGQDISKISNYKKQLLRRRIGFVFQDFRLLNHLTTYENIALPLRVRGENEMNYKKDVIELLKWVNLEHCIHLKPEVLSGGEKQRVAIARAVIGSPEIILADEPTGNVDPEIASRILNLFLELNKLGTSIVIATHDTEIIKQIKKPVIELKNGKIKIQK